MKTINEILTKAGDKFVQGLQKQFDVLGLNDTRAASSALSSKVSGSKLEIQGLLRTVVLVSGRGPGKFPPIQPIRDWVRRKLNVEESEVDGVAFVIARKIAREGTDIFTGKAKGLQIEMLIAEINKELEDEVNTQIGLNVTDTVFEAFK